MRARPERGERADRVETELDSPVYVRPPPPAPPPPRPPPRTPPPPQAALGPNTAPHGVATFGGLHGAQTAGQLQPAEHEVAGSNGWAQRAPFAQQAHPFQQAHYAQPMQQAQAYAVPPPTPFVSAPQPQHQLSQQPSAPQHYNPQEAPTKGRVVFQQHPQHGEPHDGSADSSVSYGPSPPAPSTVVEEPDEKVIVAAPQPSPFANAPRPLTAEMPVNGSGGFPVSHASPNFNEPTANREPLLLPRDPHMPAMQRALLAREAVRESDRRIALPVVIVAFVVAVGVAIGIPLLARRPSRVVTVPPASAEPSSLPGAVAGPSVTGPPVLPAPTQPTAVSTLPTGFVPPPGVMVPPVNPASPNPVTQAPTVAQPPRQAVTAQAPVAQRPAPRNPKPRPRQDPVPKPRPEPDEPIAAVPREPPTPREKDPPPTTSGAGKGLLTVICNPACDDVLDGSRSLGASPVFKASVSAGTHRLTLRISDPPLEKVVTVTVSPDETTVLTQPMTK